MRNQKIAKLTTMCLTATCLITGCSNSSNSNSNSTETPQSTVEAATPEPTIDSEIHTDNLMGVYIGETQSQIGLGLSTDDTKSIVGKPSSKEKKGDTQTWNYKDLDVIITFTKTGDTYTIQSIKGGKDATTLQTGGGITAGSSRKDIVTAYKEQLGADVDTSKNKIVIDNMSYSRLVFTLKKDKVVSICMELS